jgi:hypothetical protein
LLSEAIPPAKAKGMRSAKNRAAESEEEEEESDEEESEEESSEEEDSDEEEEWVDGQEVFVDTEDGMERATILGPSMDDDDNSRHIRFADGTIDDWTCDDFRELGEVAVEKGPPEAVHPAKKWSAKLERDSQEKKNVGSMDRKVVVTVTGSGVSCKEDKIGFMAKEVGIAAQLLQQLLLCHVC